MELFRKIGISGLFLLMTAIGRAEPGLSVDLKIGKDVANYEVVDSSTVFLSDLNELVGWTRVKGAKQPTSIIHIWKYLGEENFRVRLPVKSSSYRTHSRLALAGRVGAWELVVMDLDGEILSSQAFEVRAALP